MALVMAMATAAAAVPEQIVASALITKRPGVCGGRACIDNTRIRVADVVELQREGMQPAAMQDAFAVTLTLAQIHLALQYAAQHPDEIEADFESNRQAADQLDRDREAHFEARRKPQAG